MTDKMHKFPYWLVRFDKRGNERDAGAVDRLVAGVAAEGLTDLFVFSHGWNNDETAAVALYRDFFGEMRKLLDAGLPRKRAANIGVCGIVWPSILWPDDAAGAAMRDVVQPGIGGGASMAPARRAAVPATPKQIRKELGRGYDEPGQRSLLDELTKMLEKQPKSEAALREFKTLLGKLLASEAAGGPLDRRQPDLAEGAIGELSDAKWRQFLEVLGSQSTQGGRADGPAAGLGDNFKKLWAGAKDALRIGTYWQMKERAGAVGKVGLGRVLARLANETKDTRLHLLGHSFGARLVSFSLAGLPAALTGERSPVKSLLLLQGAFSHFAFADILPHDARRSGALKGMAARVDGPLIATHTLKDLAVGRSYPAASFVNGDDAAALPDQVSRWGAIGHDGAQAVKARAAVLGPPGAAYALKKGEWLNLDGNKVIVRGGLPSGAHGDIVHPHTAWAALAGAGIA